VLSASAWDLCCGCVGRMSSITDFVRRAFITAMVTTVALTIPALALGATGAPHAGKWTIPGGGGFTVSQDQKSISGVHLSVKACGFGNISVLTRVSLRQDASSWIVGFPDPSRKSPLDISGVVPQKVVLLTGGKKLNARLDMAFDIGGFSRDNDGILVIKDCDVQFYAHP
jgi:hypothetical protein